MCVALRTSIAHPHIISLHFKPLSKYMCGVTYIIGTSSLYLSHLDLKCLYKNVCGTVHIFYTSSRTSPILQIDVKDLKCKNMFSFIKVSFFAYFIYFSLSFIVSCMAFHWMNWQTCVVATFHRPITTNDCNNSEIRVRTCMFPQWMNMAVNFNN